MTSRSRSTKSLKYPTSTKINSSASRSSKERTMFWKETMKKVTNSPHVSQSFFSPPFLGPLERLILSVRFRLLWRWPPEWLARYHRDSGAENRGRSTYILRRWFEQTWPLIDRCCTAFKTIHQCLSINHRISTNFSTRSAEVWLLVKVSVFGNPGVRNYEKDDADPFEELDFCSEMTLRWSWRCFLARSRLVTEKNYFCYGTVTLVHPEPKLLFLLDRKTLALDQSSFSKDFMAKSFLDKSFMAHMSIHIQTKHHAAITAL